MSLRIDGPDGNWGTLDILSELQVIDGNDTTKLSIQESWITGFDFM